MFMQIDTDKNRHKLQVFEGINSIRYFDVTVHTARYEDIVAEFVVKLDHAEMKYSP